MTNFSTNQVMQFYVLDGTAAVKASKTGDYAVVTFTHADGEKIASDRIENIMYGKLTKAAALEIPYTVADIKLDTAVNGGAPIKGTTYTVRVSYPEVGGLGNEGWVTKTASVTATSKIASAEALYTELAEILNAAFVNDGLVAVAEADGLSVTQKDLTKYYKRGMRPIVVTPFTVSAPAIIVEGEEVQPFAETSFKVVESDADGIGNGFKVADMEYFALGERGDQYRMMGWPDVIESNYRVDPKKTYDVLVVHYAYKGANQNSHKSEKDLIVVSDDAAKLLQLAKDIKATTDVVFTTVSARGAAEAVLAE